MKIYVYKTEDEIECISSVQTAQTPTEAELIDSAFYFDKIQGYVAEFAEDGTLNVYFDENKYQTFIESQKKKEQEQKEAEELQKAKEEVFNLVTTETTEKNGITYKVYKIGDLVVKKVEVEL